MYHTSQTGAERPCSARGLRRVDELSGVEGGADRAVPRGPYPRPPNRAVGRPQRAGDGAAAAWGGHPSVGAHAPESGQPLNTTRVYFLCFFGFFSFAQVFRRQIVASSTFEVA